MRKAAKVTGLLTAAVAAVAILAAGHAAGRAVLGKLSQRRSMARLQRTASAARDKIPC